MDKIILKGLEFKGCHGVNPVEKICQQPFIIDLVVECDLKAATQKDCLADTIDYTLIYQEVKRTVEENSFNLIETLAEEIARRTLAFSRAMSVIVTVKKPFPPFVGEFECFAVQIERRR